MVLAEGAGSGKAVEKAVLSVSLGIADVHRRAVPEQVFVRLWILPLTPNKKHDALKPAQKKWVKVSYCYHSPPSTEEKNVLFS
jgi:hypothetical protein